LSVCIITYNEAHNLPRCLASVAFADEIIVVDSLSTDNTVAIAQQAGCRVVQQPFLGHVAQKNLALQQASYAWVLCLDADEWLLPGAEAIIRAALATTPPEVAGYTLKRHTFYLGAWVNHSGWWPQHKLRLFDRQRGHWRGRDPHDSVRVTGRVQGLEVEMGHWSYRDITHHLSKVNAYTTTMATGLHASGARRVGWVTLLGRPAVRFWRMFVLRGGWREGIRGFIIATIGAFYVFAKYAKLWEAQHDQPPPPLDAAADPGVTAPGSDASGLPVPHAVPVPVTLNAPGCDRGQDKPA
jgi:glycosyltransferase involved in cell wall biosynthesis